MVESGVARVRVDWMANVASVLLGTMGFASAHAGTTTYTYDVHGRMTSVSSPTGTNQAVTTYSYDNANNRRSIVSLVADTTPPNAPTSLTAVAQAFDRIRLTWTASLDVGGGPVSHYKLYRGGSHVASPAGSPYDDQPLSPNLPYNYTVSAVDPFSNESAQSAPASATTPPGPDTTAPSVPSSLQGTAISGTWVNLTWSPSTDNPGGSGLAGYEVFRNSVYLATSSVASYSDQAATPATTYAYTVRAYDLAVPINRSNFSSPINVTTPDDVAPIAPGNPTFGSIDASSAIAAWTAATDNVGVTGYRYSMNGGSSWSVLGNVLSTNLSGLSASTQYTMLVQARDAAGNWGANSSASFTTQSQWTMITDWAGNVVPASSTLYHTYSYCDYSTEFPYCVIQIGKKYGDWGYVWWWYFPGGTDCNSNPGSPEVNGYRDYPGACYLEASPAAYGQ